MGSPTLTFFDLRSFSVAGERKLSSVFAAKAILFLSSSSTNETVPSSAFRMCPPRNLHFSPMRHEPVASKTGHRIDGGSTEGSDSPDSSGPLFAALGGRDTNGGSVRSTDPDGKKMSLGFASR
jgi:hypothetical protein